MAGRYDYGEHNPEHEKVMEEITARAQKLIKKFYEDMSKEVVEGGLNTGLVEGVQAVYVIDMLSTMFRASNEVFGTEHAFGLFQSVVTDVATNIQKLSGDSIEIQITRRAKDA